MNDSPLSVNTTPHPVNTTLDRVNEAVDSTPFDVRTLEPGKATRAPIAVRINVLVEPIGPGHPAHRERTDLGLEATPTRDFLFRFVLDLEGEQFPEMFLPQGPNEEPITSNAMGPIPPGQLAITTVGIPLVALNDNSDGIDGSAALLANVVDMAKKDLFDLVHAGLREMAREDAALAKSKESPIAKPD